MAKLDKQAFEFALKHCFREYQERVETWRDIETKARGTLALCSALLLALFYMAIEDSTRTCWVSLVLLFASITLLAAIAFSLLSLRVTEYDTLESAADVISSCNLALLPDSVSRQKSEFGKYKDKYAQDWARTSSSLHAANQKKAALLSWAQIWLSLAITGVGIYLVLSLGADVLNQLDCAMTPIDGSQSAVQFSDINNMDHI